MTTPRPEPPVYLVFGDLHGKVLPAVKLAACWAKDHARPVAGLLQVGDLGYFPDPSRIDKATLRHAEKDPLELGTFDIVTPNPLADQVFATDPAAPPLWFTAGNHEDFDALERLAASAGRHPDFAVDAYNRVRCIRDGAVLPLPNGPRVAAVWGIDDGPSYRHRPTWRGYVRPKAVDGLVCESFDVLLTHDSPAGAIFPGAGSERLHDLIGLKEPAFAFFGHYHGHGARVDKEYGRTAVYHMAGLDLRGRDGVPSPGSVGVLAWAGGRGRFDYVPDEWLATFTRHNWKWR